MHSYGDIHLDSTSKIASELRQAATESTHYSTKASQFTGLFIRARQKLEHLSQKLHDQISTTSELQRTMADTEQRWMRQYNDLEARYRLLQKQQAEASWCPGCVAQQASQEGMRDRSSYPTFPMASGAVPLPTRSATPPPASFPSTSFPSTTSFPSSPFPSADFLRGDSERSKLREAQRERDMLFDKEAERKRLSARFERRPSHTPATRLGRHQSVGGLPFDFAVRMGAAEQKYGPR